MKLRSHSRNVALAIAALALLGGSLVAPAARAQDAGAAASDKPITLNLLNVSVPTALRLLFSSAGIRQYTIASDVQGTTNISVKDVPFSTALNSLLGSANPPATFTVDNGVYNVTVKHPPVAPPTAIEQTTVTPKTGTQTAGAGEKQFWTVPVNRYDAYIIAQLMGATGIVEVPPNYPAGGQQGGGQQGGFGGQQGGFGSQQGGFGGGIRSGLGGGFGGQQGGGYGGGGFGGGGFGGQQGGYGGGYGGGFGRGGYGRGGAFNFAK